MGSKRGKSSRTTRHQPQTNATDYQPLKQLPFDPKINRQLQLNEQWRPVAKAYLLDPIFLDSIQSLNLKDPQMLEKAVNYLRNPSKMVQRDLCGRARLLEKNFDRYKSSSKSNEYTDMWLCMAILICQTVTSRLAAHPEDLREQVVTRYQHFLIVTALLFEILADWDSPPDSFLRANYFFDIDDKDESSSGSSGRKRKRGADEQTDAGPRDEIVETTGEVEEGLSRIPEAVMSAATQAKRALSPTEMTPTTSEEASQATATGTKQGEQTKGEPSDNSIGHEKQDKTKYVEDLEGSAANGVAAEQAEQVKGGSNDNGLGCEEQARIKTVKDLEGSAADSVAEREGTTAEVPRSMLNEERGKRNRAEQKAGEERKKRKKRKQEKQKAKDRIRELEQQLHEANAKSGNDQTK